MTQSKRICILVNPKSGEDDGGTSRTDRIAQALREENVHADIIELHPKSNLERTIEDAIGGGCHTVVAAGGDGTISAVADVLLRHKKAPRMGVLPMGTFNFFARSLGLAEDLNGAVAQLGQGASKAVHLGTVNGRAFLNNVSLGLYPSILDRREDIYNRYGRSRLAAHWSTLLTLLGVHRPLKLEADLDGARHRIRTPLVFVAASAYQLETYNLAGADAVRDGRFALFAAPNTGRLDLVKSALSLAAGSARKGEDFHIDTAREITLTSGRAKTLVALDGERRWIKGPLRIAHSATPLHVIAPAA
ncbi:diacylglycerol/lipid kinase family protein [Tropicibacter naphthalenivorans]|uniref:Diacylglycerol kinase n=1 Tax=Tropicibacter naphthalenivorans TaxID=441103 RepID=A0A0P1GKC4_9RHOB|nr:diacylglycerol kinase family protein [Tropicibacter naphthalenivorans]CUH82508.1 Diacylglycerol kinase [Tropicibacter naphthalenivorans]SMD06890.1 Diacylglycerol kinase family enzyme [Tropicibacter naphthalenivorans]